MNENYRLLGLTEDATRDQIEDAYATIRSRLKEERFLEGAAGNEAARQLTALDQAYSEIIFALGRREAHSTYGCDLGEIDNLIKKGDYDQAQTMLDNITDRSAEWHFLQSIIFYKRSWFLESRRQLKTALELDPNNSKYATALTRLENIMSAPAGEPVGNSSRTNPPPIIDDTRQPDDCGACCTSLCIADCCCRMLLCCR